MYGWRGLTASPRTVEMWPVNVNRRLPEARSQILMVRSPAPVANHWFPGSMVIALTQPRCPEMTRISFHGACQTGLTCCTSGFITVLPGPAFPPTPGPPAPGRNPAPLGRNVSAEEPCWEELDDGIPSIILTVPASTPSSTPASGVGLVLLIFFRFAAAAPAAASSFACSAGGSIRTSSYSARSLGVRWDLAEIVSVRVKGEPKSAAKRVRVRLAELRTRDCYQVSNNEAS